MVASMTSYSTVAVVLLLLFYYSLPASFALASKLSLLVELLVNIYSYFCKVEADSKCGMHTCKFSPSILADYVAYEIKCKVSLLLYFDIVAFCTFACNFSCCCCCGGDCCYYCNLIFSWLFFVYGENTLTVNVHPWG